jgi:hypothetical protein
MLIGVILFIRTRISISKAQKAKGKVIQSVYFPDENGGGYAPMYQFRTLDGKSIEILDDLSSNPPRFQVGQEIDILYESANPEKARINKGLNLYFEPLVLGGMALIFLLAGFVFSR